MNKLQEYCKFISTAEIEKVTGPNDKYITLLLHLKDAPFSPNGRTFIRPSIVCNRAVYDYKPTLVLDWNNVVYDWNEDEEIRFYPAFAEKYGDILFKYDGKDGSDVVLDIPVEFIRRYDNPAKKFGEIDLYHFTFAGYTFFLHLLTGKGELNKVSLTEDGECILNKSL